MGSKVDISVSSMQGSAPVTVLHIKGEIDASNVSELESKATELIQAGIGNLLLDMAELKFMSSAGFRAIHKIYQAMHPDGGTGHLKIANASENIHHLIKTLGFDKFVPVINGDIDKVVASF